jgi:dTDP-3-amino-2,3,6-trideoxy-4-keto-D-glucose/dTDP-3-amino-3,4,6-trideoxy-alpha-D-glucose/dTDP-2,6-dideoxy-D-kanosamine transaminase
MIRDIHTAPDERHAAGLEEIPLNDLGRQTRALMPQLEERIGKILAGGWYILGREVSAFEEQFATFCGVRHCIGVANGTDALELALRALGCGPGSKVVTVANAGMYASTAIVGVGARPLFADIDPATMTMSPQSLERLVECRADAIVVTHLYGKMADIDSLCAIAAQAGVPLIEDCAQSHGAERNGRRAGAWGRIGCFSFYPTKNLGALGDAGALTTQDNDLAADLRSLRQYGWTAKYKVERLHGRNSRLDAVQAAALSLKLPYLKAWNARRREIVQRYREVKSPFITMPDPDGSVCHLCVVRSRRRDSLRNWLRKKGIATEIHYPIPDHRQPALSALISGDISLPATEQAAAEILTIPCFPEMTEHEIQRVCDSLTEFPG